MEVVVASARSVWVTDSTGTPQTKFMFSASLCAASEKDCAICEFMMR